MQELNQNFIAECTSKHNSLENMIREVTNKKSTIKYNKIACESVVHKCDRLLILVQNLSTSSRTLVIVESIESTDSLSDNIHNDDNADIILKRFVSLKDIILQCERFITRHGLSPPLQNSHDQNLKEEYHNLQVSLSETIKKLNSCQDNCLNIDFNGVPSNQDEFLSSMDVSTYSPNKLAHALGRKNNPLEDILRTICNVCDDYESRRKFGKASGCRGLASLFKSILLTSELMELLCLAIVAACDDYNFNKIEFGATGGCDGLFIIIKHYNEFKTGALEKACKAVACVSCNCSLNVEKFRKLGLSKGEAITN
jgi:hypothetical protein